MPNNQDILKMFRPVDLSGMDSIKLMNRTDTKYITDILTLDKILDKAAGAGYLAFELSGQMVHEYRSMYYDTPSLRMYLDHHNGRLVRQKLRTRCYETTGRTFLELKTKNNHGRTEKKRMEIAPELYWMASLKEDSMTRWLEERIKYQINGMSPSLETVFSRITLVNPEMTERSTIDFDLRFNNVRRQNTADMPDLVIIEVKQDGNFPSTLRDILLELRVKPFRISKYCIGTAMTDETVRKCRFKQKLILINKLTDRV